jgi:hypothetical protein
MKRFNCVVEYETGNNGNVAKLRYENIFPAHGAVKIYHPVDKLDITVNGRKVTNKKIKVLAGRKIKIKVRNVKVYNIQNF